VLLPTHRGFVDWLPAEGLLLLLLLLLLTLHNCAL